MFYLPHNEVGKERRGGHSWEVNTMALHLNRVVVAYCLISLTFPMTLGSTSCRSSCTLSMLPLDCLREGHKIIECFGLEGTLKII